MTITFPDQPIPFNYDIQIRRGGSLSIDFLFTGKTYTDYSFACEVRDTMDRKIILSITPTLSDVNVVTILKYPYQTMELRPGTYEYDITFYAPGSQPTRGISGRFIIEPDITQYYD